MKKLAIALALLCCSMLVFTPTAEAKDMAERFGIGADSALGFSAHSAPDVNSTAAENGRAGGFDLPGISMVYQINEIIGLQVIGSFQLTSGTDAAGGAEFDFSVTTWGAALRGIIGTGLTDDVNLGIAAGFSLVGISASESTTNSIDASGLAFAIEVALRPEWFITNYFSIHTQIGVSVSILNEDNSSFSEGGFNMNFFQNADLLGDAGFTFWF